MWWLRLVFPWVRNSIYCSNWNLFMILRPIFYNSYPSNRSKQKIIQEPNRCEVRFCGFPFTCCIGIMFNSICRTWNRSLGSLMINICRNSYTRSAAGIEAHYCFMRLLLILIHLVDFALGLAVHTRQGGTPIQFGLLELHESARCEIVLRRKTTKSNAFPSASNSKQIAGSSLRPNDVCCVRMDLNTSAQIHQQMETL